MNEQTTQSRNVSVFTRIPGRGLAVVGILLALTVLLNSLLIVDEMEYVVVERLGQIHTVYDRSDDRGLHWKLPWPIDVARRFDARLRLFDPAGREVFTRDRKNITIDAFVCWRIGSGESLPQGSEHPVVRFYRAFGDAEVAESRLDSRIRTALTTAIGQLEMTDLLGVTDPGDGLDSERISLLSDLGQDVMSRVQASPDREGTLMAQSGVELVDLRIKRINFPRGNQQAVFERMRSERQKIAESYRSAGQAESAVIRSAADLQYREILARAAADAERIRGDAEAEAIGILNEAYAVDPEFYEVVRTLEAYRQMIGDRTTLVLSADSPLFRLLTSGLPTDLNSGPSTTNWTDQPSVSKPSESLDSGSDQP